MDVVRHAIISWEPLRLLLIPRPGNRKIEISKIQKFLDKWMVERDEQHRCQCNLKYVLVEEKSNQILVHCQWVCEKCLPDLLSDIARLFPVATAEIGTLDTGGSLEIDWIYRPERKIVFENGIEGFVQAFFISRMPISVGQFSQFVQQTGYKTTAELGNSTATFFTNFSLSGFSTIAKTHQPACFISMIDAQAYCSWAGKRLPTEAEVFSACLIDLIVYDEIDAVLQSKIQRLVRSGKIPIFPLFSYTSESELNGLVVARRGPRFILTRDWASKVQQNRRLVPKAFYDVLSGFHVCQKA